MHIRKLKINHLTKQRKQKYNSSIIRGYKVNEIEKRSREEKITITRYGMFGLGYICTHMLQKVSNCVVLCCVLSCRVVSCRVVSCRVAWVVLHGLWVVFLIIIFIQFIYWSSSMVYHRLVTLPIVLVLVLVLILIFVMFWSWYWSWSLLIFRLVDSWNSGAWSFWIAGIGKSLSCTVLDCRSRKVVIILYCVELQE